MWSGVRSIWLVALSGFKDWKFLTVLALVCVISEENLFCPNHRMLSLWESRHVKQVSHPGPTGIPSPASPSQRLSFLWLSTRHACSSGKLSLAKNSSFMWCWTWTLHNFHPWPWPYPSMPPGMSLISASQGGSFKWLPYLLFHWLFFQVTPESSALLLLSWSSDNLDLLATLFGMSVSVRHWGFPTVRATFPSALSSWDYTELSQPSSMCCKFKI